MGVIAARQPSLIRLRVAMLATAAVLLCAPLMGGALDAAQAQTAFGTGLMQPSDPNANMVLKAKEMVYDNDHDVVTANGGVQIYYDGRALQADRVVYDRKAARLKAYGNVVITERDGTVAHADMFDVTDDFRDGFANSLRMETVDQTTTVAARAERTAGNVTVFENGVYTACAPCKDNPQKPPLWQIKAAKVIHNEQEKMIYFEDARFEFLGVPIAYVPYFSTPDPTVKRKTGFLTPTYFSSSELGYGVKTPYYFALAPNYDLTLTPGVSTKQGPMMEAEWRHRLVTGSYSIRAAGAFQADPDEFYLQPTSTGLPGSDLAVRDFRGSINTTGEFWLNERWKWGWDVTAVTDRFFLDDYSIDLFDRKAEAVSTLYLTGQGNKSWFEARAYYFLGLTRVDVQDQLPIVHPVIDYDYIVDRPVMGGELGWNINMASLTRRDADIESNPFVLNPATLSPFACDGKSAATTPRDGCIQRGIDGTYTRFSANLYWKRTFTDPIGQRWTPFAYIRGDMAWSQIDSNPTPVQFVDAGTAFAARMVPAIGLEYRYPFVAQMGWGSQVIEPIAQVILRPRMAHTGQFPDEDSQSLVYDDANLFQWDKFSGYDRLEDGSRVNAGVQYTLTTNGGGYYNAMFGQSYSFGGTNPYADPDMANVGLNSGLDTDVADYVGRLYLQPVDDFALTTSARFNEDDFSVDRLEVGAIGTIGPVKADVTYGRFEEQPALGLQEREGVRGKTAVKVAQNWIASVGAIYDLDDNRFASRYAGLSYLDECVAFGVTVSQSRDETSKDKQDTSVMFQLSLRGLTESGNPQEFADKVWNEGFKKY